MTQSSCKHDKKSRSHPGMKVPRVRVFSCKHPLSLYTSHYLRIRVYIQFDRHLKTAYEAHSMSICHF